MTVLLSTLCSFFWASMIVLFLRGPHKVSKVNGWVTIGLFIAAVTCTGYLQALHG